MPKTESDLHNAAREVWAAAVRADPSPTVHYFQQLLADNLERFDEAIVALERAHRLFSDDVLVICYLALALHSGGQSARALAYLLDLTMAHETQPDLEAGRWALGNYTAALVRGEWSPDGVATLELTGPLLETKSADQTASV